MSAREGEIVSIQYLRGIAATMVVFAHANHQFTTPLHQAFRDIGWSGVDLFFVISGFVMTYTVATHNYSWREFVRRRIERIVPLYWVATIFTAILAAALPSLFLTTRFTWPLFLQSLVFWPCLNPVDNSIAPILKLGWTVNFEMFFYALFALSLWAGPWLRAAVIGIAFLILTWTWKAFHPAFTPLEFYANTINREFVFGCILGAAFVSGWFRKIPLTLSIPLFAVGTALLLWGAILDDNEQMRWLLRGIPAALIITSLVAIELKSPFQNAFLHKVGDATYSIYLSHLFVVMAIRSVLAKMGLLDSAQWPFVVFSVVIAVVVGAWLYAHVERPLIRRTRTLLGDRRLASARAV
jgi:exopolysaccharide production protein ExoZ